VRITVRSLVLIAISSALLGGACVALYEGMASRRLATNLVLDSEAGLVIDDVNTLALLRRRGTDELVNAKEQDLSGRIWALSEAFTAKTLPPKGRLAKALKSAARYRAGHPFETGDTQVDHSVERLLKSVGP
jgi:hypothetical protein